MPLQVLYYNILYKYMKFKILKTHIDFTGNSLAANNDVEYTILQVASNFGLIQHYILKEYLNIPSELTIDFEYIKVRQDDGTDITHINEINFRKNFLPAMQAYIDLETKSDKKGEEIKELTSFKEDVKFKQEAEKEIVKTKKQK